MKKILAFTLSGLATGLALLAAAPAMAGGVGWSVNVGVGGYSPYPPAVVYQPPYNNYSNYYAPPVVYGSSVPVYQAPPVMYGPPPEVYVYGYQERPWRPYRGPRYDRPHEHRGGYDRGHREYRDYRR